MSEPMVRVVSVLCVGNDRERLCFRNNETDEWTGVPYETTAERVRFDTEDATCAACTREGIPRPHLRFATEPVDLEPREEQAG